jgi:hypothetical protein
MTDYEFSAPTDQEGGMSSDASFRAFDQVGGQLSSISDELTSLSGSALTQGDLDNSLAFTDTDGVFAAPAPTTIQEAIRRIAAEVANRHGTIP